MGREAVAVCTWAGRTAEVKLHLDSRFLQLRGDIRADIPRDGILDAVLIDGGIRVNTSGPALVVEFSTQDAERWRKAILKKPPTLAEKLGVNAQNPAYVLGHLDDQVLAMAVQGMTVSDPEAAAIFIAVLMKPAQLDDVLALMHAHPNRHIWMVHEKGKAAGVSDAMVRRLMREKGYVDSKTSAISDQLTSTRYRLRSP